VDYYSGLGVLRCGLTPLGLQEHMVFATFDLKGAESAEDGEPEEEIELGADTTLHGYRCTLRADSGATKDGQGSRRDG
jgi:hypothetical protein